MAGGGHLSGPTVAGRFERPTRDFPEGRVGSTRGRSGPGHCPIFGLAGGGVCLAGPVAGTAVSSYLTFSPLPDRSLRTRPAVSFLWHFPWGCPRWTLSTTVPCPVRTFLPVEQAASAALPPRLPRLALPGDHPKRSASVIYYIILFTTRKPGTML